VPHLEALVLENALDGSVFAAGRQLRLEDDAERTVSHNLALCVREVLVVAGHAVLHLLADDFCRASAWQPERWEESEGGREGERERGRRRTAHS